jgi:hypothetical protein
LKVENLEIPLDVFGEDDDNVIGNISASLDASVNGRFAYIEYSVTNSGSDDQEVSIGTYADVCFGEGADIVHNVPVSLLPTV